MAPRAADTGRESDQQLLQRARQKAMALAARLRSDAAEMAGDGQDEAAEALERVARGAEEVAGALPAEPEDEEQDGSKA